MKKSYSFDIQLKGMGDHCIPPVIRDNAVITSMNKGLAHPVVPSISMQHSKNPFQLKSLSENKIALSNCTIYSSEYKNYKKLPTEEDIWSGTSERSMLLKSSSVENCPQSSILHPITIHSGPKTRSKSEDDELEDMFLEIKLNTSLSKSIEAELKLIKSTKPITKEEIQGSLIKIPIDLKHKKTLIVDLDETLIHAISNSIICHQEWGNVSEVIYGSKYMPIITHFILRPFTNHFLEAISRYYEIIIYTASDKKYADAILDYIDTSHAVSYRLYRQNCFMRGGNYIKDLRIMNRNLQRCAILDNSALAFMGQLDNLIPIKPFMGNKNDFELYSIISFLIDIKDVEDVRTKIKQKYFTTKILNYLY